MIKKVKDLLKYFILVIFLFTSSIFLYGCTSLQAVSHLNLNSVRIYKIITVDGNIIDFKDSELGFAIIIDNELVYLNKNGTRETVQLSDINAYFTKEFDLGKTIISSIFITIGVIFITTAILTFLFSGVNFGG